AYQAGPRVRSTRKTWPEVGSASTVVPTYISRDIFGTRCYKLAPERPAKSCESSVAERRRNRTFQPVGCTGLPVLKTGWATRPLPLRGEVSLVRYVVPQPQPREVRS